MNKIILFPPEEKAKILKEYNQSIPQVLLYYDLVTNSEVKKYPLLDNKRKAVIYNNYANLLYDELKDYPKAKEMYLESIKIDPDTYYAYHNLANDEKFNLSTKERINYARKAIDNRKKWNSTLTPGYSEITDKYAEYLLSYLLIKQQYEEKKLLLATDEMLNLYYAYNENHKGKPYEAYLSWVGTMKTQNEFALAAGLYQKAIEEIGDKDNKRKFAIYHHYAVLLYEKLQDYTKAKDAFEKSIKIDPDNYHSYKNLANMERLNLTTKERINYARKAIDNRKK